MHGEIDGTNSAEESAELKNYLDAHADAMAYYEELRAVDNAFRENEGLDPPPSFKASVLAGIRGRTAGDRGTTRVIRLRPRRLLRRKPAYAFATGLLIGFSLCAVTAVILVRSTGTPFPVTYDATRRPYGMMMAEEGGRLLSSQCIPLELEGLYGGACIEHVESAVSVHLGLSAPEEIRILFEYDSELHFEGYTALDDGEHTFQVGTNMAELKHSGDCDYNIRFRDGRANGSPLRMKVLSSDEVVFDMSISPDS